METRYVTIRQMSPFANWFLQVDMSSNAEQSGSPGDLELDKRIDVANAIANVGQDGSEGDNVEGDEAKGNDTLEKPEAFNEGDKNPAKTGLAEKSSGLPTDSDGDVVMNVCGDVHDTTSIAPPLDNQPAASAPALANVTPASTETTPTSTFGASSPPAPSTETPLSIVPASLASGKSSTQVLHPFDEDAPAFLSPATLAHLRGASPAEAWQNLITTFLRFEKASPPPGVCF